MGKSAGLDSLAAEHFVYSHSSITVHLSLLFTCMLSHGYIPSSFMKTSIIAILKKTEMVIPVIRIITDLLPLSVPCQSYFNCVYPRY